MKGFFYGFVLISMNLFASRGLVVACNDNYVGYFMPNLAYLRRQLKCDLPVEVWYAGDELSEENQMLLSRFNNITFHDIVDVYGGQAKDYWGYHIKGLMLKASSFSEVMIVDADVYFVSDPAHLFDHPRYLETGAYFFRDFQMFDFTSRHDEIQETENGSSRWKHGFIESYWARRHYFQSLIFSPSQYLPEDMRFFWENKEPTAETKLLMHYQESGVVLIDKQRHRRGVEHIYQLNRNYQTTYQYVAGDKETYWMGMEMAKEPYAFNEGYPMNIRGKWIVYGVKRQKIRLAHKVDGKLCWFQKNPIDLGKHPIYKGYDGQELGPLTPEEVSQLDQLAFYVRMFGKPIRESLK